MSDNPFSYGKTVDDPFFYGRKREIDELTLSLQGGSNVILYSPRRYGKSSLIKKILKGLEKEGYNTVYIDFFKITSKEKFIELYAREVTRTLPALGKGLKKIQEVIRGIRPAIGLDHSGLPEFRITMTRPWKKKPSRMY